MSDSVQPHRWQPTRLPCPWDSPGKNWSGLPFPSPKGRAKRKYADCTPGEHWLFLVQCSRSLMSNSLRPHEPHHSRPPCPSPTPGVHTEPCSLSQCCHLIISSSVIPFSSCPRSFPESGSFQMSQLFTSGGQSIGVSASTSVLPMNTQD